MAGKHAGVQHYEGTLRAATLPQAEVATSMRAERLTNLNLHLLQEDGTLISDQIYGKVVMEDQGGSVLRVHFTSLPKEVEALLS